jgi:Family of unknown function (DUF5677)
MHQRATAIVGFPEFQDRVTREFPSFFGALPALQGALNDLTNEGHDDISAQNHLILNLGILAGVSMMETVLLGINGFGPGAMKAVRSLLEASVTAEYIRLNPEAYDDFFEWAHVERFRELEFLRQYLPQAYARLDDGEFLQSATAEMNRVENRFGRRQTWCRHDLAERARQTGYLESYRVVSPTASSFVHVTPYGLHKRFEANDRYRMSVPPSMSWVMQAFISGHSLTLGMVHTLIQTFHPDREDSYRSLERDFRDAWPPLEQVSTD